MGIVVDHVEELGDCIAVAQHSNAEDVSFVAYEIDIEAAVAADDTADAVDNWAVADEGLKTVMPADFAAEIEIVAVLFVASAVALVVDFVDYGPAAVDIGGSGPVLGLENGFGRSNVLHMRAVIRSNSDGAEYVGAVRQTA